MRYYIRIEVNAEYGASVQKVFTVERDPDAPWLVGLDVKDVLLDEIVESAKEFLKDD